MPNFRDIADLPFDLAMAEQEIYATYGDRVSIWDKRKSLLKFGTNEDIDSGVQEMIWSQGGFETYATTNSIDAASSSSVSDTQTIRIEGHTVVGTGVNQQFTFVVQDVTLTGQTPVALATPLARVSRMINLGSTEFVGDVYIHEGAAVTGGVPDDLATSHMVVRGSIGHNQSRKAATTISNVDYLIIEQVSAGVERGAAAAADIVLELRTPGTVFAPKAEFTVTQGGRDRRIYPYLIVPKNADIRMAATTNTANCVVTGSFEGFLAKVTP